MTQLLSLNITTNHKLDKTKPTDTLGYQIQHGKTNFYHHCVCIHPHHPESHRSSLNMLSQQYPSVHCSVSELGPIKITQIGIKCGWNVFSPLWEFTFERGQNWFWHFGLLDLSTRFWFVQKILTCPNDFDLSKRFWFVQMIDHECSGCRL